MSVEWMAEMTSLTEVVLVSKGCHVGRVNRPTPRAARGGHGAPWDIKLSKMMNCVPEKKSTASWKGHKNAM